MWDTTCRSTAVLFLLAVLSFGVPSVLSARGQRVRSSPDIPVTQFSCADRPSGYYADVETGCQVYHMCTEGGNHFSYRCPNSTLFLQRMLICAHSYQVNCNRSDLYFSNNLLIGQRDKHFVNDDPIFFSKEKELKTLQNPDTLQNLGQASREGSSRQAKSHSGNENVSNRVFQNNFKRADQPIQTTFIPRNTQFPNAFSTTTRPLQFTSPLPSNAQFSNSFLPTNIPFNKDRTEDLSNLPLAGSVLPGGLKSFQFNQNPQVSTPSNRQTFQTNAPTFQPISFRAQTASPTSFATQRKIQQNFFPSTVSTPNTFSSPPFRSQKTSQPTFFNSPSSTTPNSIDRVNLFATTKSPINFSPKFSAENSVKLQPSGFVKPLGSVNSFAQDASTLPSFEFQPPTVFRQPDLVTASQENAVESRRSSTPPPPSEEEFNGVNIPETDVKAVIEQTKNGSLPVDKYNTFLKRFNPYEEPPKPTEAAVVDEGKEFHTFINRFVPDDRPLESQLVTGYNLEEQPGDHVFVDRFVLTPEEIQQDKNRQQVDRLHSLLPPVDQLTISFPTFDLVPPAGEDSDNSESNKIELQFQDPRSAFFIPSGDGDEFSKADAAPIVVTIPLHSNQRSTQMLFRKKESKDACAKCHPSFIVNQDTCTPCVIIR